ncbi:MAG: DUF1194 domain-containing protein [Pseudomonadota bacterium]
MPVPDRLRPAALAALVVLLSQPAMAQRCRQALALGLDVSLSVNPADFSLQRGGLARALIDPEVMAAILIAPDDVVELAIFEWSGQYDQALLVDWTPIRSRADLERIAGVLLDTPQIERTGRTAIGAAMRYGAELLRDRARCGTQTLDLSGDGPNNNGAPPERVRAELRAQGIIVNGLAIETPDSTTEGETAPRARLRGYYEARVITGASAFVETVFGFENFEAAMKRKLLRELIPAVAQR